MTYLIIFNGPRYSEEKISFKSFDQFMNHLYDLVQQYGQLPDLIYLKDGR